MATQTQVVQSQLPAAFETYFKEGVEGSKGLIPKAFQLYGQGTPEAFKAQYTDPLAAAGLLGAGRVAPMSADQKLLGREIQGLGSIPQFASGTAAIQQGVGGLSNLLNQQAQTVSAPNLQQFQMGPADVVYGQQNAAPSMVTAQTGYQPQLTAFQMDQAQQVSAPNLQQFRMGPAQQVSAPNLQQFRMGPAQQVGSREITSRDIQAAQTDFSPQLERFQMTAPDRFSGATAQEYMSPFMQNVVDIQQRRAIEDAQKSQLGANLGAVRQGTYGGARQTLAQTERERGLREQLGDIQGRGQEAAFGQAQQQFERDRAAQMTAQRENLQAALGVQTLGTQTGLQTALANLSNEQQARVQSESNRLQAAGMTQDGALRAALANQQAELTVGQQNLASQLRTQEFGAQQAIQAALANQQAGLTVEQQNLASQLQTQGLGAQQAIQAALANQQAGLTVEQQNLASRLGVQQLGTQTGVQTALANLSAEQQANVQNQAAQLQTQGLNAQQAMQAALANQQAGLTVGQQNLAARLGIQQLGAGQSLEAQRANQAADLQASEQQAKAALGLGQMGQQFGQIGLAERSAELDRLKMLGAFGDLDRGIEQQGIDARLADLQRGMNFPDEQLDKLSGFIRGIPMTDKTITTTTPPPSFASQISAAGLSGLALSRLLSGGG